MKTWIKLAITSILLQFTLTAHATVPNQYPCYFSILGSGVNVGPDASPGTETLKGEGTEEDPFIIYYHSEQKTYIDFDDGNKVKQYTAVGAVCDITLSKETEETTDKDGVVINRNVSYPDDRIYFQYNYENVPLTKGGFIKVNSFGVVIAMGSDSSMTPSHITDDNFPKPFLPTLGTTQSIGKRIAAKLALIKIKQNKFTCPMTYNFKLANDTKLNEYSAQCPFILPASSEDTISGSFNFFISLKGNEEIRRFKDENGTQQGSASIVIDWVYSPEVESNEAETNFNLEQ